jgi:cysteine sulfinate desulfinase/cysteine desulfurase-like protein
MARALPAVTEVGEILSMYVGRSEVLVTLRLSFEPRTSAEELERALAKLEEAVHQRYPMITRLYFAPG